MIRQTLLGAALVMGSIAPAHARDQRLATRLFNPDEVVRIEGRMGVQASIAFAEDEHIENIAIGDSNAWQVTPNKRANLLFVKPLSAKARTNMTVVTDRHTYFFDLSVNPGATPLYVLRFTYPKSEKPVQGATPALAGQPLTSEEQALAAGDAAQRPVDPASLNFAWKMKGKAGLLPMRIYDDGTSTYLQWSPKAQLPAIQVRDTNGVEGPVNYAVRGEMIVVDGTPAVLVLRAGKDFALLERGSPPPPPSPSVPASANPANALATPQTNLIQGI